MRLKRTYIATIILNIAIAVFGIIICSSSSSIKAFETTMILSGYMLAANFITGSALVLLSFVHKPLFEQGLPMLKVFLLILLLWITLWLSNRQKWAAEWCFSSPIHCNQI